MTVSSDFDVIVIGAGSMGSAAIYQLAKRGKKVLGIEQFDIPHLRGSYLGESRLIRFAYQQGDYYVPLLMRAGELWREIERESGQSLFVQTGGLSIAALSRESFLDGVYKSLKNYQIPHRLLKGKEVNALYPAFTLPSDFIAIHDEWAGYILSEKSVAAFASSAIRQGAQICLNERVISWESDGNKVNVTTDHGRYRAEKLVIAPGAWFPRLVPEFEKILKVYRVAISWYKPENPSVFTPERFPVFILQDEDAKECSYGVPVCDNLPGVKIGQHNHLSEIVTADSISRTPRPEDEAVTRYWTERYFDLKGAECLRTAICMYTVTPDEAFILGPHPAYSNVILGHACSGHGFKFTPVIGEILADFVIEGKSRHNLSAHNPQRFK